MRLMAGIFALLLCTGLALGDSVNMPGYNCPAECDASPHCYCASGDVPGGLAAADIPQFIVLTNDDAITVTTQPVILGLTDKFTNKRNGCKIPATWFVSINYTDPDLVQEVYMKNHEIASHTFTHVMNPDINEIVSAKLWLNMTAHVPLEKIRGFRAPFLVHNEQQRTILQQNGFLYDSSIPEPYPTPSSPSPDRRLWPYTMDYGLPQRCDLGTGTCSVNESHPGLWEFPMWDIQDDNNVVLTNMDPQGDVYEAYKREFDRNYNGNRAPLGIYIHAAWLIADPTRLEQLENFIRYALTQDNVVFATISEVLDWIKDPVPYKNYTVNVGCKAPTDMWFPSGSFCKKVQCVHGNWSDVTCSCSCAGQNLDLQPGFCPDADGACTVPKVYDDGTKTFYCPNGPAPTTQQPQAQNPGAIALDPSCGHGLMSFSGVGISGTQDNAALYTEAIKAVDGLCTSCALANAPKGNYYMVGVAKPTNVKSVYIVTNADLNSAFVFAGNSSANSGLNNPICAKEVNIKAATPSLISCDAPDATYVTIAVASEMSLCDIFIMDESTPTPDTSNIVLPSVASAAPTPSSRKLKSLS